MKDEHNNEMFDNQNEDTDSDISKDLNDEKQADSKDAKALSQSAFDAFMSSKPQPVVPSENKTPTEFKNKEKKKKSKKKKVKRTVFRIIGSIFVIALIFAVSIGIALTIISFATDMLGIKGTDIVVTIDIPAGSTTNDIAELLKENDIIKYPLFFKAFVKLNGSGGSFYYEEHDFKGSMSYQSIISELQSYKDRREVVDVMFKEGIRLVDAANILEEKGVCDADDFLEAFNTNTSIGGDSYNFNLSIDNEALKLFQMEGYLFPDTYTFYIGSTCREDFDNVSYTIDKIKKNYNNKMNALIERIEELDMSIDDVMTLASVIQAEAGNIEDMEKVSSVFWNRLNSDEFPMLQSDPTSKYVREVISEYTDNQEMMIAYDTYQGNGLPPGPICNPGLDAIKAALYPADTEYYFFCSNINTREFYYAKTNAQHEKNLVLAGLK